MVEKDVKIKQLIETLASNMSSSAAKCAPPVNRYISETKK
jgi:hypothetical protein